MTFDAMATINILGMTAEEIIKNRFTHSILTLIIFFAVAKLVTFLTEKIILKLTSKTKTKVDDELVKKSHRPVSILLFLIGIKLAIIPLKLNETTNKISQQVVTTLVIIVLAYTLIAVLKIFINAWGEMRAAKRETEVDQNLVKMSSKAMKLVFFIIGFLFILYVWDIKLGPLLTSLGIAGIAIAFGLQNTLGNIFGGISLILDRSIKVGDIIKTESGEMGTVYDVGLRATRIKTFDNEIVIVPNGQLANSRIHNFVLPDRSIRVNVEFGVEYGADPEFVKHMAVEEVNHIKDVMHEPAPWILFNEMGDNALHFKIMFWVDDLSKKWPSHQEAITRIYRRLYKEGIGIPFPQRTVWTYNAGKAPKHNPYDRKYSKFNKKYNTTLAKKEKDKNPEEEDTKKVEKEMEKEAKKRGKE